MLASLPQELRAHIWSFRAEALAKRRVCRRCRGAFWDSARLCRKCVLRTRLMKLGTGCCAIAALSYLFLSCDWVRYLLLGYLLAWLALLAVIGGLMLFLALLPMLAGVGSLTLFLAILLS